MESAAKHATIIVKEEGHVNMVINERSIIFKNVLHLRDLWSNLLAVSALDERGYPCTFEGGKVKITRNGVVYAQGERRHCLHSIKFELNKEHNEKNEAMFHCETNVPYQTCNNDRLRFWHQRLGAVYHCWSKIVIKWLKARANCR